MHRKEPECLAGCQSRVTTLSPASNDSQPMQNDSHQTGSAKWKNKLCWLSGLGGGENKNPLDEEWDGLRFDDLRMLLSFDIQQLISYCTILCSITFASSEWITDNRIDWLDDGWYGWSGLNHLIRPNANNICLINVTLLSLKLLSGGW